MVREAGIAQMVEQRTCNAKVPSSILGAGTTARNIGASGGVGEWLKPADCKSVAYGYAGSNPAPSTSLVSFCMGQKKFCWSNLKH